MVSYMELVRRDHDVELTEWSMVSGIKYGLFSPVSYMRPGTTLCTSWSLHTNLIHETIDHSVNSTSWSLLTNSIHKTMDHSVMHETGEKRP
jgi:hypothetical protein